MVVKEFLLFGFIFKMFQFCVIFLYWKVNKVIFCIFIFLLVIDGCIYIFYKFVKDWFIDIIIYGYYEFIVVRDEGSQIFLRFCEIEFNDLKYKGIYGGDFSDIEIYVLQYGVQYLLDVMGDKEIFYKFEEFVENYVIDLEFVYVKFFIDSDLGFQDILSIKKLEFFEGLFFFVKFVVIFVIFVMRKYKFRFCCYLQ